jgi:acyl-CoA thioesterase I
MGSFFKDFEVVDVNRRACCLPLSTLLFEMASRTFSRLIISAATACILLADVMVRPSIADTRVTRVVALGDSLTAGYGLPNVDAFPSQLEHALRTKGYQVTVANAGVSGDTAAMGLARLNRSVPENTDAVILELGANDMLKGYEPVSTRRSLMAILRNLRSRHIVVLLCGVRTAPSRGDQYRKAFAAMFAGLAREYNLLFYPVFDEAFVDDAQLRLPNDLHPTAAGVKATVTHILPKVEALVDLARHRAH